MEPDDDDNDEPHKLRTIPQRYIISGVLFAASLVTFIGRIPLELTAKYFVQLHHHNHTRETCGHLVHGNATDSYENYEKLFAWDAEDFHVGSGFFYLGYSITHLVGGIYADRRSPKHVNAIGMTCMCILNIVTPFLLRVSKGNVIIFKILRFGVGASQGVFFPCVSNLLSHWVPLRERAFLTSVALSGIFAGIIIAHTCTDPLVRTSTWETPFYVYAGLGLVVVVFWELLVYPNPNKSPLILEEEKAYLDEQMRGIVDHKPKNIPYRSIFTSLNVWALLFVATGQSWIWNIYNRSLPSYVDDVLKYDRNESVGASAPFVAAIFSSLIFGVFSDWVVRNSYINLATVRKLFITLGMIGAPVYMLTGTYANCNRFAAQTMFMIALSLMVFVFVAIFLLAMDVAPNYSGFLTAIANGIGMGCGFFIENITDQVLNGRGMNEYRRLYWICVIIGVLTTLGFVIAGNTRLEKWNRPVGKEK